MCEPWARRGERQRRGAGGVGGRVEGALEGGDVGGGEEKAKVAAGPLPVPLGPLSIAVSGACVSTVTPTPVDAGEAFPAASVATAVSVWAPSASVRATVQAPPAPAVAAVPTGAPPSRTRTDAPASAVPLTVRAPSVSVAPSAGLVMDGAAGAVPSTVHVRAAGVGSVPVAFLARTWKLWTPSASAL